MSTNWRDLCRELISTRGPDYYRTLERARKALADEPEPASVSEQMPLSPAALSIWNAFCGIVEDHGPPRLGIAAALRAAASQLTSAKASDRLRAIADELEAHDAQ